MASPIATLYIQLVPDASDIYLATQEGFLESGVTCLEGIVNLPSISQRLSDITSGTIEIGQIEVEIAPTTDFVNTFITNSVDPRNKSATVKIYDADTLAVLRTVSGKIRAAAYTSRSTIRLIIADASDEVLSTPYPKMVIAGDLFGSEEMNNLDLNLPVPIVLGATREKVPCRYVEEDFTNSRYRYVFGCDLSTDTQSEPLVAPFPNAVYQSYLNAPTLIPPRNYSIERQEQIEAPNGPSDGGQTTGTLNASIGTTWWVYTVLNGVGETPQSAPFKNLVAYNGSSIGAQKLIFDPTERPTATGFRFYRSDNSGTTYGLVLEVTDPEGYRQTDANGNIYYQITDNGLTADTLTQPPITNTTRGGVYSILFDRLQWGQSSQIVPISADVEFTEIADRSDTLGLWLFRNDECRDLSTTLGPRPYSPKAIGFWDFNNQPAGSGVFDKIAQTFTGTPGTLYNRIQSSGAFYTHRANGFAVFGSPNYATGLNGYPAYNNSDAFHYFIMPSASANAGNLFNFDRSTSFKVTAIVRPELGTGGRRMTIMNKGQGTSSWWEFGVLFGRAYGCAASGASTPIYASGTTALDGGWHEIGFEITREGTVQGAPPIPSPAFASSTGKSFRGQQYCTVNFTYTAGSNNLIVVTIHTTDDTQICTPATVTFNGVSLNPALTTSIGSNPYLASSIYDKISPVGTSGTYSVVVAFAATTIPDNCVVTVSEHFNINQGSGTSYRDIVASGSAMGATSSTMTVTPTEAQNKSWAVDALTLPKSNTSCTPVTVVKRADYGAGDHGSIRNIRGLSGTKPEVGSGAQDIAWTFGSSTKYAHAAVWYKPLASATGNDIKHDYINIYVDRQLEASVNIDTIPSFRSTVVNDDFSNLIIGEGFFSDSFWWGQMDSVCIASGSAGKAIGDFSSFVNGKANAASNALVFASGADLNTFPVIGVSASNRVDQHSGMYDVGTTSFTCEGWFYVTASGTAQTIFSHMSSTATDGWRIGLTTDLKPTMVIRRNSVDTTATATSAISLNRWTYIAYVAKRETTGVAGDIKFLVNGEQDATVTTLSAQNPVRDIGLATTEIDFGRWLSGGSYIDPFMGYMDELHLYAGRRTVGEARKIWGLGVRNIATQIQVLMESGLHGPGQTIDSTTWQTAITDISQVAGSASSGLDKYVTDFSIVEQQPLRDILANVLRVRGMRLGMNTSGAWTLQVDKDKSVYPSGFGFQDGVYENISRQPEWTSTDVKNAVRRMKLKYRIRRNGTGGIDGYTLKTAQRDVMLTLGTDQELTIDTIRDRETADRFANYLSSRIVNGDIEVQFETGADAALLQIGDVINVSDGVMGFVNKLMQVYEIRSEGLRYTITARGWSSGSFTYTPKLLPLDVSPESQPSYEGAIPLPPTNITVETQVTADTANVRVKVSWVPPNKLYGGAKISYRQSGNDSNQGYIDPWRQALDVDADSTSAMFTIYVGSAATRTYTFGVQVRSPFGKYSSFGSSDPVVITN